MTTKAQKILEIYKEDPSLKHEEIAQQVGCDVSYVSKVIGKLEDHMIAQAISFHLKPPKQQTTDDNPDDEEPEEYVCGGCGHQFTAREPPESCPNCGVTFA